MELTPTPVRSKHRTISPSVRLVLAIFLRAVPQCQATLYQGLAAIHLTRETSNSALDANSIAAYVAAEATAHRSEAEDSLNVGFGAASCFLVIAGLDDIRPESYPLLREEAPLSYGESEVRDFSNITERTEWYLYIGALALGVIFILTIYGSRGISVSLCICGYVMCLSIMSVLLRRVFKDAKFPYPLWVTSSHFLATAIVGLTYLSLQKCRKGKAISTPSMNLWLCGILPIALATTGSIGFANRGLLHCDAHFYEMFSVQTLLVTAAIGTCLGRRLRAVLVPPLLVISAGLIIVSVSAGKAARFELVALPLILAGVVLRAFKVQMQGLLLSGAGRLHHMEPMELICWSSWSCFIVMFTWSAYVEGLEPYRHCVNQKVVETVGISAVAACCLNVSSLFVLGELGPVAQQAVGQLKGALGCLTAVVVLGEHVNRQEAIGYVMVVSAIFWFNRTDLILRQESLQGIGGQKKQTPNV